MDERTNEERLPDVDIRQNAGINRPPLDEIKAIQTLLAAVYKDAGGWRTCSGNWSRTPTMQVRSGNRATRALTTCDDGDTNDRERRGPWKGTTSPGSQS